MTVLYRPGDGAAGDFIPFFWEGDYHLFYIKEYGAETGYGPGRPWFHLVTRDFVTFEDWGEDDRVALSGRIYDRRSGTLGLFVTEGEARFDGIRMATR